MLLWQCCHYFIVRELAAPRHSSAAQLLFCKQYLFLDISGFLDLHERYFILLQFVECTRQINRWWGIIDTCTRTRVVSDLE